jgi:hypothetical protein
MYTYMYLYIHTGATTATEGIQATTEKQKSILSEINKEIKEDEKEIFVRKKYRDMYVRDVLTEEERNKYDLNVMHGLLSMIDEGKYVYMSMYMCTEICVYKHVYVYIYIYMSIYILIIDLFMPCTEIYRIINIHIIYMHHIYAHIYVCL